MVACVIGLILIAFTVFSCLPTCLNWGVEIIAFLKGSAPVFAALAGIIAIFIGIADIKDKKEAKKEADKSN